MRVDRALDPPSVRRRVLMLAYFFPPLGGAGVQRTLKHAKYLPEHGWDVTVVTTAERSYPVVDESLLDEIPATTRVLRAREVGLLGWLRDQAAKVLDVLGLSRFEPVLRWPDNMVPWLPGAFRRARAEMRQRRPDVLYSTSAPYGAHLVAYALHRLTGVPWVADFRDEWTADVHQAPEPRITRWLSARTERAVTSKATEVTVVAEYFTLAGEPARRTTIPNGVDASDFPPTPDVDAPSRSRLRLSYVGALYGERDCRPVLAALRRLERDGGVAASGEIELRIVGNVWADIQGLLPARTTQTGYVDHGVAVDEMRTADVLLFYAPKSSKAPSGKLYEYLASGRPILCVAAEDNAAFGIVDAWGAGISVEPDDDAGIERALVRLHERWSRGELRASPAVRERALATFSREALAGQLAEVLERVSRPASGSPRADAS